MSKKSILVTGCSGLVGTHIVNQLIDRGYLVIGVDLKEPIAKQTKNFKFHNVDLRDVEFVIWEQLETEEMLKHEKYEKLKP